jgi:hypothetical protein
MLGLRQEEALVQRLCREPQEVTSSSPKLAKQLPYSKSWGSCLLLKVTQQVEDSAGCLGYPLSCQSPADAQPEGGWVGPAALRDFLTEQYGGGGRFLRTQEPGDPA